MRFVQALLLALLPGVACAQAEYELGIFAAMIEAPEGTPAATATATGGVNGILTYLTSASVVGMDGACVRIWDQGGCTVLTNFRPLPGSDRLVLVDAQISSDEQMAKFSRLQMTRMPQVGNYDPAGGEGVAFMTQNALGGWEMPVAAVSPSGQSAGLVILRDPAFTEMSAGAPVAHPENGLVGVIARAGDGAGAFMPVAEAFRAAKAAGVAIDDSMMPRSSEAEEEGGLPPRIEEEIGRIYYFHDYSDLGYFGAFYGPTRGAGFDPGFVTTIDFSVWSVALSGTGGSKDAQGDKTVPLVPSGMSLEAPFRGNAGDHLASCIIHTTPTSGGQPVYVVQFWRSAPERYNPNVDAKSYDEAAPAMTGWAEGADACATALAQMDPESLAALAGSEASVAQADKDGAAPKETAAAQPSSVQGGWRRVPTWNATGLEALLLDIPGGHVLTAGCTQSRELAIAISPADRVGSIDGKAPTRTPDGTGYVLRSSGMPKKFRVEIDGESREIKLSNDIGPCK